MESTLGKLNQFKELKQGQFCLFTLSKFISCWALMSCIVSKEIGYGDMGFNTMRFLNPKQIPVFCFHYMQNFKISVMSCAELIKIAWDCPKLGMLRFLVDYYLCLARNVQRKTP